MEWWLECVGVFYLLVSGQILILFTGLSVTCDGASDGAELETKDSAAFTFKAEITFEFKVKKNIAFKVEITWLSLHMRHACAADIKDNK